MSIFSFLNFSSEKNFALDLVQQIVRDLPPSAMSQQRKVLSVNKITKLLERGYQLATVYQNEHRIGFVKRAVLVNDFKWGMKGKGYPDDFIDVATEGLVVALSKATKSSGTKA